MKLSVFLIFCTLFKPRLTKSVKKRALQTRKFCTDQQFEFIKTFLNQKENYYFFQEYYTDKIMWRDYEEWYNNPDYFDYYYENGLRKGAEIMNGYYLCDEEYPEYGHFYFRSAENFFEMYDYGEGDNTVVIPELVTPEVELYLTPETRLVENKMEDEKSGSSGINSPDSSSSRNHKKMQNHNAISASNEIKSSNNASTQLSFSTGLLLHFIYWLIN